MKDNERLFGVKFIIDEPNIQIQMSQHKVSPQEAIGLLEMAKRQLLDSLARNKKDVFNASRGEE